MAPKNYANASAFRTAVETRLLQMVEKEPKDIMRLRRQFTFDCFLCRVFHGEKDKIMLKGGYAIELRVATARTTKDIDLCMKKVRGAPPSLELLHSFFQDKANIHMIDACSYKEEYIENSA